MKSATPISLTTLGLLATTLAACTPPTADLQAALDAGGAGYILSLCAGQTYHIASPLQPKAPRQEISTQGYPTGSTRAILLSTSTTQGTVIDATGGNLDGVVIRNVQVDGGRTDAVPDPFPADVAGSSNIEMGGDNANQVIEYVYSHHPKTSSCLHVIEGQLKCNNATVRNNQIGPCGRSTPGRIGDGIMLACTNSVVELNTITDATDGGIVIFSSPHSTVRNNRIVAQTAHTLGGINLVDLTPYTPPGNYTGVRVLNNAITGGFATSCGNATGGPSTTRGYIGIGIPVGWDTWVASNDPRVEAGEKVDGPLIGGNVLSGAMGFGIAVAGAEHLTVANNVFENAAFIGDSSEKCYKTGYVQPPPMALLENAYLDGLGVSLQSPGSYKFKQENSSYYLICYYPPSGTADIWPYPPGMSCGTKPTTPVLPSSTAHASSSPRSSSAHPTSVAHSTSKPGAVAPTKPSASHSTTTHVTTHSTTSSHAAGPSSSHSISSVLKTPAPKAPLSTTSSSHSAP